MKITKKALSYLMVLSLLTLMLMSGGAFAASASVRTFRIKIQKYWANDTAADRPASIIVDLYNSLDSVRGNSDDLIQQENIKLSAPEWSAFVDTQFFGRNFYIKEKSVLGYTNSESTMPYIGDNTVGGYSWQEPDSIHPLGSANYYSVLTFGDFEIDSADVESGLAIGGDFKANTKVSYAMGLPTSKNDVWGWYAPGYSVGAPIATHNPRLIVNGAISSSHGIHAVGGNIVVASRAKISGELSSWKYNGTGLYDSSVPKTQFTQSNANSAPYNFVAEDHGFVPKFFSEAEQSLKALNARYENTLPSANTLVCSATVPANGELKLEPTLPEGKTDFSEIYTIVFNVTAKHYPTFKGLAIPENQAPLSVNNIVIPKSFHGSIIINVLPDPGNSKINTFNFAGGTTLINGEAKLPDSSLTGNAAFFELCREYSGRITWNFPSKKAAEIITSNHSLIGSVLAPYCDFKPSSGNVNGSLVAKSVKATNNWEAHSTAPHGNYPSNFDVGVTFTNYKDSTQGSELGWMRSSETTDVIKILKGNEGSSWTYNALMTQTPIRYFETSTVRDKANELADSGLEWVYDKTKHYIGEQHIWDRGNYYNKYKNENGDAPYAWASWENFGANEFSKSKMEYSMRRFSAYMSFSETELSGLSGAKLAPKDELGQMSHLMPINDTMFVFVNGQIAYWGGTDIIEGNNQYKALNRTDFLGKKGIAVRDGVNSNLKNVYPHTDGWCIDISVNSSVVDIKSLLKPGFNRIDIITDDFFEGGGMNKLYFFPEGSTK